MRKERDSLLLKKERERERKPRNTKIIPYNKKALIKAKLSLRVMLLLHPVLHYRVCSWGPSLSFLFWSGVFCFGFFPFLRTALRQSFWNKYLCLALERNSKSKQSALLMAMLPFWEQHLQSLLSRSGKALQSWAGTRALQEAFWNFCE